jgi:hypothetical protein
MFAVFAFGVHQAMLLCIAQPAGTLSVRPIELKLASGAVKVTVTSKVVPGGCAAAGKTLIDCAGPGGIGVGVGVGVGVGGAMGGPEM